VQAGPLYGPLCRSFFKTIFAEHFLFLTLSKVYFAESLGSALGKVFFLILDPSFFVMPCVGILSFTVEFGKNFDFIWYIWLINFVSLISEPYFKFVLQHHEIMKFAQPKIDIHDV